MGTTDLLQILLLLMKPLSAGQLLLSLLNFASPADKYPAMFHYIRIVQPLYLSSPVEGQMNKEYSLTAPGLLLKFPMYFLSSQHSIDCRQTDPLNYINRKAQLLHPYLISLIAQPVYGSLPTVAVLQLIVPHYSAPVNRRVLH